MKVRSLIGVYRVALRDGKCPVLSMPIVSEDSIPKQAEAPEASRREYPEKGCGCVGLRQHLLYCCALGALHGLLCRRPMAMAGLCHQRSPFWI